MERQKFHNPAEQIKPKRRDDAEIEGPEFGKEGAAANTGSQGERGKKGRPIRKPWGMK